MSDTGTTEVAPSSTSAPEPSFGNDPQSITEVAPADTPAPEPTLDNDPQMEWLRKYFAKSLGIWFGPPDEPLLDEVSFKGIAKYLASDKCNKVVVMTGAGISTSAGIPDFRSPGTGVYEALKKEYNIENPQQLFTHSYFMKNPEPYYKYRKELWRFEYKPTACHYFIKLLEKKNKLLRHFTQNIDSLETLAGISEDRLIQAHGTVHTGHCMKCKKKYNGSYIKERVFGPEGPIPKCDVEDCGGVVRPDIVMFEENLPQRFGDHISDVDDCDLLLIMGTSLVVRPFSNLPIRTKDNVPRLYINMEDPKVAANPINALFFGGGFDFGKEDNIRDVFWKGTCDDGCYALADLIGWGDELRQLVREEHTRLDKELGLSPSKGGTTGVINGGATGTLNGRTTGTLNRGASGNLNGGATGTSNGRTTGTLYGGATGSLNGRATGTLNGGATVSSKAPPKKTPNLSMGNSVKPAISRSGSTKANFVQPVSAKADCATSGSAKRKPDSGKHRPAETVTKRPVSTKSNTTSPTANKHKTK